MKKIKKIVIALLVMMLAVPTIANSTSSSAKEYTVTQEMSEWNIYLYEHQDLINVYNELFDARDEEGNRLYSDEFLIGMIANVEHEGAPGIVEYYFSSLHYYDFYLPSGGVKIKTVDDVYYLMNWTTTNEESTPGSIFKGSCGVSSVQWSYTRRIKWLNKLLASLNGRTVVTQYDLTYADVTMMLEELDVNGIYYRKVLSAVGDNGTAMDYAEALCDYYFIPANADLCYSNTGTQCQARRASAADLWEKYTSEEERMYTFKVIDY